MTVEKLVWAIIYINNDFRENLDRDGNKCNIQGLKFIVPTVKVLRKQFRGKKYIEEVPLLFNYGFIRIPISVARNKEILMDIKKTVPGVYSWLWVDKKAFSEKETVKVETVSFKEILRIVNISRKCSIYSANDINNIKEGSLITLKGYPFDDMDAVVISINKKKSEITVDLDLGPMSKRVTVDFSNAIYSIHSDFEEPTPSDDTIEGRAFFSRKGSSKSLKSNDDE